MSVEVKVSKNLITFKSGVGTTTQNNAVNNSSPFNLPQGEQLALKNLPQEENNHVSKNNPYRTLGIVFASITAVLYAIGIGIRYKNKANLSDIQKCLSDAFRKEFSETETKQFIDRYKDLFKIDNANEFIKKSFEQIKNDYGYKNADIPLEIEYLGKRYFLKHPFKKMSMGCFDNIENKIRIWTCSDKDGCISKAEKKFVFETLFHELKHMEQAHFCYIKDKDKFFEAISKSSEANGHKPTLTEKKELIKTLNNNYSRAYENVSINDISKYNDTIEKYIENTANYKDPTTVGKKEYLKQILEKEAFEAQKAGSKFIWFDIPLFYLPKAPLPYILAGTSIACFTKDYHDSFTKNG